MSAAESVADPVAIDSIVATFAASYPFGLDPFQEQACRALAQGRSVLLAAPTGAGKTVVGEFAADRAIRSGGKCFYTTPIKALSNQKFTELAARYGGGGHKGAGSIPLMDEPEQQIAMVVRELKANG